METTNPEGGITRRGFLGRSSAALASAGLIRNAFAAKSVLISENAKASAMPLAGKIALEDILSLPKLSNQVTQSETFTLKRDRKSSTSAADASRIWIAVVSTSASFR